jgi:surface polysaccharide O-acyltransferase-like enzyme
MKERDISLDVVRCLACMMVVLMHSPMPDIGTPGVVLSAVSLATVPCIGLFFMVSGALLLPAKDDTESFLKRRFTKILWPTFIWSLFYLLVKLVTDEVFELKDLLKGIISMPFSAQGHGVMWFMYVLAGLYLLTPILSPWIKSATKRQLQFYLLLWLITMCYPLLQYVVTVNNTQTGALFYFSGYVGYFVLGYYLRNYPLKLNSRKALVLILIPFIIATFIKLVGAEIDFLSLFGYLSILTVISCIAWFSIITSGPYVIKLPMKLRTALMSPL